MDPRQHLRALQAQVAAARAAFDAGDRNKALENLNQALSIDPSFLAAQSLRERVLAAPLTPAAVSAPALPPGPVRRVASNEAYERIELRARQRRVDHCIAATRAALGRQQPDAAAAALAELIALDPHESNVASLSAELADLRRRFAKRPFGVRLAAASAFLAVAGTASWLEHPRRVTPPVGRVTPAVEMTLSSLRTTEPTAVAVPESGKAISVPSEIVREPSVRRLESRVLVASAPVAPPSTRPSRPIPAPVPVSVPVPVPARPPVSTPATASLSLPVPLSQLLQPVAAAAPHEPAAASASPPPVVAPAPTRARTDQELVEEALQRYRRAYGRLNVQSAQAVYPTVNRVALARAFDGLESQSITFDACDVEVRGVLAKAICHGTTRYVPKIGTRYPRAEPLVWSFELRKSDDDWTIYYAKASR